MDPVVGELRELIDSLVREGFGSAHEIVTNASDYALERHGRRDLRPLIKRLVGERLEAHLAQQGAWETPTDCDRLDQAFASLNQQGIVARQDFSCCNTCGFTEIWDEVGEEEKRGPVAGYVFYHLQCTERAMRTGQLLMAYGSVEENVEALRGVASRIVAELQLAGLNATWAGTDGDPIVADGVTWRKRREREQF